MQAREGVKPTRSNIASFWMKGPAAAFQEWQSLVLEYLRAKQTFDLTGDEALTFVRLKLDGDDPARSRGYDMLMQLLYAGVNSGDLGSMLGLGTKLLGSMDTNLNAMTAVTLASAVKGGDDRSEMALPTAEQVKEP